MSDYPKFYTFNSDRRVYVKDERGIGRGGPIFSEHFQLREVTGETDKEYICDNARINKRSMKFYWLSQPRSKYQVYTEAEREAMIWMNENRYQLMRKVEQCQDIETLKRIAEMVGYK